MSTCRIHGPACLSRVCHGPDEDEGNHVVSSLPQRFDDVEYCTLLLMWDEFKEAYDLADEATRARLRAERECFL